DIAWSLNEGFENLTVTGTANVALTGNNGANALTGNSGSNFFNPRGGDDTIQGGAGNDAIRLGGGGVPSYGNKVIDGGAGFDRLDFGGLAKSRTAVDLARGTLRGGGEAGGGSAGLAGIEAVMGDGFNDRLNGSSAADSLSGGGGKDTPTGRGGVDPLPGGLGQDLFNFFSGSTADLVTDFLSGTDKLGFETNIDSFDEIGAPGNF